MNEISREVTFSVKITGERTKKNYEGSFTVKAALNFQEQIDVGLLLDQYNRGSRTVPDATFRMNRALAELDVRIVVDERTGQQKAPSWWRDSNMGREILDKNVVLEVFLKALETETEYDKRMKEAGDDAEQDVEKQSKKKAAKSQEG